MTYTQAEPPIQAPDTPGWEPRVGGVQVWIVGDSHVGAVANALKLSTTETGHFNFVVDRLCKHKNGVVHGDIDFDAFEAKVAAMSSEDIVVSMIGGNHHQTMALAQHPIPFNLFGPEGDADLRPERATIPRALVSDTLRNLQKREINRLRRAVSACRPRIFHVLSPPPRRNEEDIKRTRTSGGIITLMRDNGVSPPELRMATYKIQCEILKESFKETKLLFIDPPDEALDELGFIKRQYQADDATHANAAYGSLLIQKIMDLSARPPEDGDMPL